MKKSRFLTDVESFNNYVAEQVENDPQKRKAAVMIVVEENEAGNGADCVVSVMGKENIVLYGLYKFVTTPGVDGLMETLSGTINLMKGK